MEQHVKFPSIYTELLPLCDLRFLITCNTSFSGEAPGLQPLPNPGANPGILQSFKACTSHFRSTGGGLPGTDMELQGHALRMWRLLVTKHIRPVSTACHRNLRKLLKSMWVSIWMSSNLSSPSWINHGCQMSWLSCGRTNGCSAWSFSTKTLSAFRALRRRAASFGGLQASRRPRAQALLNLPSKSGPHLASSQQISMRMLASPCCSQYIMSLAKRCRTPFTPAPWPRIAKRHPAQTAKIRWELFAMSGCSWKQCDLMLLATGTIAAGCSFRHLVMALKKIQRPARNSSLLSNLPKNSSPPRLLCLPVAVGLPRDSPKTARCSLSCTICRWQQTRLASHRSEMKSLSRTFLNFICCGVEEGKNEHSPCLSGCIRYTRCESSA